MLNKNNQDRRLDLSSEQLLTEHQAAKCLAVSVSLLQKWRHQRKGPPYHKLGRSVRYSTADLSEFIQTRRIERDPGLDQ